MREHQTAIDAMSCDRLRVLLKDVAESGVAFDDPRIGYVEVQIDRDTWEALTDAA